MAYEIDLPENSRIHNSFHVPRLKNVVVEKVKPCTELPSLNDEGKLILELEAIIDKREKILRNSTILKYLVKWKNLSTEDATWMSEEIMSHPKLLEDKKN